MFKKLFAKMTGKEEREEASSIQVSAPEKEVYPVAEPPKEEPPSFERFEFNVAGVTAKNDKKQDIQKLLKQKGKQFANENYIEMYGGYTNKEIKEDYLEVSEFEDLDFDQNEVSFEPEPNNQFDPNAIKVFIKYEEAPLHIGYVPKNKNVALKNILDNQNVLGIEARYVGGKIKSYDDYEEKIVTEELTLGVEVKVLYR